jgi:predicted aldo/keto reductase-like oxidoreductase
MEKRKFGKTGLEVTLLGFGGFHLLEIPQKDATELLNAYLDAGGNYIETAASYGAGEAERKIGNAVSARRDEYVLVTKSGKRDGDECREEVMQSLENLKTDKVDVLLMHGVGTMEELDKILSPGGAFEAAQKLVAEGKVGHIGLSMHGQPDVLISALNRAPFEVVMTTLNYYDIHNFPKLLGELVPLANEKEVGIILMKPLADGLLYKNAEEAFKYAFSLPVSVVVTGMNNMAMLKADMALAENFTQLSAKEMKEIAVMAPELGRYVCRRCGTCADKCPQGIDFEELFRLEGLYDRQMRTGQITDTGDFALRDRLRFWFGAQDRARKEYEVLPVKGDACINCGDCARLCPYGIDIERKVSIADYKLAGRENY